VTDFRDELVSELLFQARGQDGFFTLYLTDGTSLNARPVAWAYGKGKRSPVRLLVTTPEGKVRRLSADRLEGFSPPPFGR
jgi:transcriptional antiterminator Rof (Rho-off)